MHLCRVFPTSLKGTALSWFTRLPTHSIDYFDTLVKNFGAQFPTSRPHHLTSIALVNIQQEKTESLRTFMERFGKIVLNIRNLSPEVAMHHMVTALKPGPFSNSLCKKPIMNLDELRQRAAKFMQLEELRELCAKTRVREEAERRVDKNRPMTSARPREFPKPTRFTRYTPLTTDRSRILEEALSADLLTTLKRTNTPPNADKTKHCRYHRNFGHTTEDCWALKDKIEELVQAGHLHRFVQGNQEDRRPRVDERRTNRRENRRRDGREDREPHNCREGRPMRGVINTIVGDFVGGGRTYSSRKRQTP